MIVLADNDVILKLAQCDLLDALSHLLAAPIGDIYISSTAKFQLLPKNPQKALAKCGNEASLERVTRFLAAAQTVPVVANLALLARMAEIPGIDGGEQQLFAAAVELAPATLLTGDRRALGAVLGAQGQIPEVYQSLVDQVLTFESALLLALHCFGFEVLKGKLLALPKLDGVLKYVVKPSMQEADLVECLVSYSREVWVFLAYKDRLPA